MNISVCARLRTAAQNRLGLLLEKGVFVQFMHRDAPWASLSPRRYIRVHNCPQFFLHSLSEELLQLGSHFSS